MALAVFATLTLAAGGSKPVAKEKLPSPVLAAFLKAYPSARLKACSSEQRAGTTCYELESRDGKIERDLIYAADGSVLEIEESLALARLPDAVKRSLAELHPKAIIKKAEKRSRGSDVSYEVVVQEGKKRAELVFDADGKPKK
jgi:hypothetical protein